MRLGVLGGVPQKANTLSAQHLVHIFGQPWGSPKPRKLATFSENYLTACLPACLPCPLLLLQCCSWAPRLIHLLLGEKAMRWDHSLLWATILPSIWAALSAAPRCELYNDIEAGNTHCRGQSPLALTRGGRWEEGLLICCSISWCQNNRKLGNVGLFRIWDTKGWRKGEQGTRLLWNWMGLRQGILLFN